MVFFFYLDVFQGGGVERVCIDFDRLLRGRKHQVLIVPRDGKVGMPIPEGCSVVENYQFRKPPSEEISRVLKEYDCESEDVAYTFHMRKSAEYFSSNYDFFSAYKCALFVHAPLAFSYGITHESPLRTMKIKHFLEFWRIPKILCKNKLRLRILERMQACGRILVASDAIEEECRSFGIQAGVLGNGIDIDRLQRDAAAPCQKEIATPYMIHVARLSEEKRQSMLLRAYAASGVEMHLVIVGEGCLLAKLKQLAISLGIREKVNFMGYLENPYPLLKSAHFSVLCSQYEGFGLSVGESLILGTPVLMTDCPYGIRSLLPSYNPDYICADSEEELADRIHSLCSAPRKDFYEESFLKQISLEEVVGRFMRALAC